MSRKMLRLVIVLATISLAGILVTQVFWLRRAFDLREKQFTLNVNLALKNVVESLCNYNGSDYPGNNPVEQLGSNYFIVRTNNMIEPNTLEYFLTAEFEKRSIASSFEYGIYDCRDEQMVYGNFVSLDGTTTNPESSKPLPTLSENDYYFGVYFPERPFDLAGQMGIWTFSTLVLVIVVIFFAFTLFVIFRQKRLSEIQRDFINNITHEFKTPISTIALSTDVLKDPEIVKSPERLRNYATIIESENSRLKNQVEKVLQVASIDNEEIGLKKEVVDLNDLINEAIDRISIPLGNRQGDIDLDSKAAETTIKADRLHISNILFNLLDNAVKYTDGQPSIIVTTESNSDMVCVSIIDNGKGITREEQSRIFDRFYRVSTGNLHDVKGFGIGLNYVKIIAIAHGGHVTVDSKPGHGSTFKVTLPLWKK
ncbi:MAG: HAMP domain-containing sensor histidine kinase [Bacteroidota bacterium]